MVIHFLLTGPDKKPKQNSSKTKWHSQQQEAKSVCQWTTVSQQNFFWHVVTGTLLWLASFHCPLYFLAFHWLRPAIFVKLNSLPICKGKPYLKLSKLTLSLPECFIEFCEVTLTFEYVDKNPWCDHSNESSLPVFTHGAICLSKF